MDKQLVSRFDVIIDDEGYDLKEDYVVAKKHGLLAIILARNEDKPIHRTKGE